MWKTRVLRTALNAGPRAPAALMMIANHVSVTMRMGKTTKRLCGGGSRWGSSECTMRRDSVVVSSTAQVMRNWGVSQCPIAALHAMHSAYAIDMGASLRSSWCPQRGQLCFLKMSTRESAQSKAVASVGMSPTPSLRSSVSIYRIYPCGVSSAIISKMMEYRSLLTSVTLV